MPQRLIPQKSKIILIYSVPVLSTILLLAWVIKLWGVDLGIPFVYSGDALAASVMVKGIIDNGWYLYNNYLGTPFGLNWSDYPLVDSFNFLLIKLLTIFSPLTHYVSGYGLVINLFFILTFCLISLTSFYVCRQLKISFGISLIFSILYAFQPYHFYRGIWHLFLSAYYMVPLAILIVLWIWSDGSIFFTKTEKIGFYCLNLTNSKSIFTLIACLITSSTGVYYAFFSCFFTLVAGVAKFLKEKTRYSLISSFLIITLISSGVFLNVAPSWVYWLQHGSNPAVSTRHPLEAEVYGLKTVHLILPVENHRIPFIKDIKQRYNKAGFPLEGSEIIFASLGLIGSLGFLGLLGVALFGLLQEDYPSKTIAHLATLNLAAILLASIGSFSSLFNLFITPQIRAYNRISIFIAFFSLLAVAIFLEKIIRSRKFKKPIVCLGLILVLGIGVLDQTTEKFVPAYTKVRHQFKSDEKFVKAIEGQLSSNSMVFQLPYIAFPEGEVHTELAQSYGLFRGYLHSKTLKWSFGAMTGRHNNWYESVSKKNLDEMLTTISAVGFKGIYVYRAGYPDLGQQIEAELKDKLNVEPIVSPNSDLSFFNIEKFNTLYRERYSETEIQAHKEASLNPKIKIKLLEGFYFLEGDSSLNWRWADREALLRVKNVTERPREVTIDFSLATEWETKSSLKLEGDLVKETLEISAEPVHFRKKLLVPPGKHFIKFVSDAELRDAPGDPRSMFFRVINFQILDKDDLRLQEASKTLSELMQSTTN